MRRRLLVASLALLALAALGLTTLRAAKKPPAPLPRLPRYATFAFEVVDGDSGERIPAKLTFLGTGGTPDPAFTRGDVGREEDGGVSAYNRMWTGTGVGAIALPAGQYDVWFSRGPEWDSFSALHLKLQPEKATEVRAVLHHVVETPGWISADLHVHAAKSPDSRVPMIDRVYEFAGDGVDLIVSTDHNVVSDYAPFVAEAGLGTSLASIVGDELTTNGWGHFGAFPLPEVLEAAGGGAVLVHGRAARDFFADVRRTAPDAVIDVHHPRIDTEIGYFNVGQLDGKSDVAGRPGFSFDFDCIEVLNGYQDPDRRSIDRVIEDWFGLLRHGHLATATGNSDTHHLTSNIGGYPRNYIEITDDRPQMVRPNQVARALKAHRSYFTTGPIVKLHVNGGRIGDTVPARGGQAHAEIEVRAAPWVSVSQVRLFVNGREEKKLAVPAATGALRLQTAVDLAVPRDAFIVLRVDGDRPMSPIVGDNKRFTVHPLALTNPVFIDADGNGRYDAPDAHGAHAPADAPAPRR